MSAGDVWPCVEFHGHVCVRPCSAPNSRWPNMLVCTDMHDSQLSKTELAYLIRGQNCRSRGQGFRVHVKDKDRSMAGPRYDFFTHRRTDFSNVYVCQGLLVILRGLHFPGRIYFTCGNAAYVRQRRTQWPGQCVLDRDLCAVSEA